MPEFKPFKAYIPENHCAQNVLLGPDTIYNSYSKKFIQGTNPFSFNRVLAAASPDNTANVALMAQSAKKIFHTFIEKNVYNLSEKAAFYIYQTQFQGHTQSGIIGLVSTCDYNNGLIKKHENTRVERENHLQNFINGLGLNTTPVMLTYKNKLSIDSHIRKISHISEPLYTLKHPAGIKIKIWEISEETEIQFFENVFSGMPNFYIADGHHRAKASANLSELEGNKCNYFPAILIPANQLIVHPFVRIVKTLYNKTREKILEELEKEFSISEVDLEQSYYKPLTDNTFILCFKDTSFQLTLKKEVEIGNDTLSKLDVSILQKYILEPIFGIEDPKTDPHLAFHPKNISLNYFKSILNAIDVEAIFICKSPSVECIFEIANQGLIMPPKSTSFEPKVLSGLILQPIEFYNQ